MKSVLVTTRGDRFGGILATAYRKVGGPEFDAIVVLPGRTDLVWPFLYKPYIAIKLLGINGILRMFRYARLQNLLSKDERELGFGQSWPEAIASPNTKIVEHDDINSEQAVFFLKMLAPDLIVSIGAPKIIKKRVLEIPRVAALNVHNGKLPLYRGHFGTFWEVVNRERYGYACIHEMVPKVDAGLVAAYERFDLSRIGSFLDLMIAKKKAGGEQLGKLLSAIERTGSMITLGDVDEFANVPTGYYGWPEIDDVHRFSWRNRARAA